MGDYAVEPIGIRSFVNADIELLCTFEFICRDKSACNSDIVKAVANGPLSDNARKIPRLLD